MKSLCIYKYYLPLIYLSVIALQSCEDTAKINEVEPQDISHPLENKANLLLNGELLPDLQTVVPLHLQIQNAQKRETVRFSNGIANTGAGHLYLRPEFPGSSSDGHDHQHAWQRIFSSDGSFREELVSTYEYHPEHNHWHIDAVAKFVICTDKDRPDETQYGDAGVKVTFCLVDWYKMEGPSKTPERTFFACDRKADKQGISPGWVDQYNQAVPGQELDITGAPAGEYYLVSTSNPDLSFIESDYQNNTAWVKFQLSRESKGNAKLKIIDQSVKTGPLSGAGAPNR
ncbi:hypothetical protein BH23BAC1_BH23BAC1_45370 [soil metagenome]